MLSLLVLAAGKSTRMRGKNKLLTRINGKAMIRRVVEAALNSKVDEVVVVLGSEAGLVREALSDLPCRFVVNRDFEKGQSSSVKAGLREVRNTSQAILVVPGDMAMIGAESINLVVDAYNHEKAPIVVASHNGRHGHPILLAKDVFEEIEKIDEESFGLKSVVKNHENEVKLVETGMESTLLDVDTPEDLRRIREIKS